MNGAWKTRATPTGAMERADLRVSRACDRLPDALSRTFGTKRLSNGPCSNPAWMCGCAAPVTLSAAFAAIPVTHAGGRQPVQTRRGVGAEKR